MGTDTAVGSGMWARRLLNVSLALWVVAIPLAWISGSYLGVAINAVISAPADDGHCTPETQGVGIHCFGDYYYPAKLAASTPTWADIPEFPHSYTAIGMVPHAVAMNLGELLNNPRAGLIIYLIPMVVAALIPAVLIALRLGAPLGLVVAIVLGVASQPVLLVVDRGNSAALAVPALLWVCWATVQQRWWQVASAVVLASAIRPQFALVALVLVAARRWLPLIVAAGASLAINLLAFMLWPGGFTRNLLAWSRNILAYSDMIPLERNNPSNLATAHALTVLTRLGRFLPEPLSGLAGDVQRTLLLLPWLPGFIILVAAALVLLVRGRTMPSSWVLTISLLLPALVPSLSFGYYLVVVLPLAAALLLNPRGWLVRSRQPLVGLFDAEHQRGLLPWLVVGAVALTLVPIPIAVATGENSVIAQNLGLLWSVTVVALLVAGLRRSTTGSISPTGVPAG